ncbi:uncharacterized protein LOC144954653 [Lampetra fluviatilis]
MSPSLIKQEPEENLSLDTFKEIEVKYEEVKVKCEDVMVKSQEVKVKCEDDNSTPKWDLHIDGDNVKQEENSDCEAERGDSQQFVEVEVWVDFLRDNTKSNGDPGDAPRPLELLYRSCFQKRPAHNNNNNKLSLPLQNWADGAKALGAARCKKASMRPVCIQHGSF